MKQEHSTANNARAVAAQVIEKWRRTELFPDRLIAPGTTDRAFVVEVVYGVVKNVRMLEWVVDQYAERRPDDRVLPFLLVGLYQILIMDAVQEYAAVNETVQAVKAASQEHAAGFVNGVLRRVVRERDRLRDELSKQKLGIIESHPDILIERWRRRFGDAETKALCEWNNGRARVTVAFNPLKTTLPAFMAALAGTGVEAVEHPYAPKRFLTLPPGARIPALPGFGGGHFSVQDPSTFEAVRLLDPQPGDVVFDACASPGGKTILIAEQMRDTGTVVAMDLYRDRLGTLERNVMRMGLLSVKLREGNAAVPEDIKHASPDMGFDRMLLDVPCSNTGVLRRRPDARWRFSGERLEQLVKMQRALLDNASGFLKTGGTMVYSTCSLEPEENAEQIEDWLRANRHFELVESSSIFPPETGTDGVYAAALKRVK